MTRSRRKASDDVEKPMTYPWGRFLRARHEMIHWMRAEDESDERIRDTLSMDLVQVQLIAATPLSSTEVHLDGLTPDAIERLVHAAAALLAEDRALGPGANMTPAERGLREALLAVDSRLASSIGETAPNDSLPSVRR